MPPKTSVRPTSASVGRDLPLEIKRRQSLRGFFSVVLILDRREEEQHEPQAQEQFHADRYQMESQSVVPSATGGDFQQKYQNVCLSWHEILTLSGHQQAC